MNLYLLRVGADSTPVGGGFYSRIFEDRSFVFIPIPEEKDNLILSKALTYRDFKWGNKSVVPYLPHKIWSDDPPDQFIHNDPEFETFTYGSPQKSKGRTEKNYNVILNMKEGDILVFYAAFSDDRADMKGLYFFAYFVVDCFIKWDCLDNLCQEEQALVRNNHHFIHELPDQVVIVGSKDKSKVFKKAILLSSSSGPEREGSNYRPCQLIQQNLEYRKPMNRSSLRRLSGEVAGPFKEYLDLNCT